MAERFQSLGYATCAIGKWHLGDKPEYRPTKRGFDEFYGTLANTPFFHPTQFVDSRVSPDVQKDRRSGFLHDGRVRRAGRRLARQAEEGQAVVALCAVQRAACAAASAEKYLDRFKNITEEKRRMFAAMMSAMDDAVGKILDKVRDMGEEENTLMFFFSDNGGPTKSDDVAATARCAGSRRRLGKAARACRFACSGKGTLPAGKTYENPIIQLDILPTALAAAGVEADPEWKLDGVNLLPYLTGEEQRAAARNALLAIRRPMGGPPRRLEAGRRQRRRSVNGELLQPGRRHIGIEQPGRRQSRQSHGAQDAVGHLERRASAAAASGPEKPNKREAAAAANAQKQAAAAAS